jgi:hypothetical protein
MAFESAYASAGSNPAVIVDPSGPRVTVPSSANPVSPQPTVQTWSISRPPRDCDRVDLRAFISTAATGGWLAGSQQEQRS